MKSLLDFYRFLRSFAVIKISGGFPERFLNLCNKEKIYLWDTLYENNSVTAKIYCKDVFKLRKIRAKSGVKIKITDKQGLIFYLRRNKKRKVLTCGIILSLVFMTIMNQFVWSIEAQSTQNISEAEILKVSKQLGLDYGTAVPFFDESEAAREAVNLFNGRILWAAVNIKGSKANIEVREYTEVESRSEKNNLPCNIIADFDGVILSAQTFSGVLSTSSGSAVKNGDLLISGISENADGSVNFHAADGKLTAFHKQNVSRLYKMTEKAEKLNVKYTYSELKVFSLDLPLSLKAFIPFENTLEYETLIKIGNSFLPFGITKKDSVEKTACENRLKDIIHYVDEFTKEEYKLLKNTLITNSDYSFSVAGDGLKIKADYDCIDFIGKKSVILQEN